MTGGRFLSGGKVLNVNRFDIENANRLYSYTTHFFIFKLHLPASVGMLLEALNMGNDLRTLKSKAHMVRVPYLSYFITFS